MKRLGLRVPIYVWEKLKKIAKFKGYTLNKLILEELWKMIDEWDEKQEGDEINGRATVRDKKDQSAHVND